MKSRSERWTLLGAAAVAAVVASGVACSAPRSSTPVVPVEPPVVEPPLVDPPPKDEAAGGATDSLVERVVVGSCLDQTKPHPILRDVQAAHPDVLIFGGDNVYADAFSAGDLARAYETLGESRAFSDLVASVPQGGVLAVWDDHDYGRNDSGAEFELKADSKRLMLDFFGEPKDSERRTREGNYGVRMFGPQGRRVQVLLLDTRWFRGPLRPAMPGVGRHRPTHDATTTVLGEAQWRWLEAQLRAPADLRLLVSSIQVLPTEHAFEAWGLFPHERERLLKLVATTGAEGVVVLSGDRHRGELSCAWDPDIGYPLFELTASSFNRSNHQTEDNRYRVPHTPLVGDENFGVVDVDWRARFLRISLWQAGGEERLGRSMPLGALRRGSASRSPDCEPL